LPAPATHAFRAAHAVLQSLTPPDSPAPQ